MANKKDENNKDNIKNAAIGFMAGAAAGAAATYLADQKNRKAIKEKSQELKNKGKTKVDELKIKGNEVVNDLRKKSADRLGDVEKGLRKSGER